MFKRWWAIGAIAAGLAVAFGAFGAHGLKNMVDDRALEVFHTGARYHMYHAFALLFVGLAGRFFPSKWVNGAGIAFLIGLFLFSGSLYVMTLTGMRWLGAITPFGGLSFMVGWILLATAGLKSKA